MKGYLRRTLESARGTEQRLKPLTGSVFAGNLRRQQAETHPWGEETSFLSTETRPSPSKGTMAVAGTSSPGPSRYAPLQAANDRPQIFFDTAASHDAQNPASHAPAQPARQGVRPNFESSLTTPNLRETLLPPVAPARTGGTDKGPFALDASSAWKIEGEPDAAPSAGRSLQHESSTRDPAQPPAVPQARLQPLLPPQPPPRPKAGAQSTSANTPRDIQEPEIQVHIGRIEVIAATPQPQRAPAPRASRSTSLSDYLAGRNGRST